MNRFFPRLFERGGIGTLEVDNRIIKAPTMLNLVAPDDSVTSGLLEFFAEEARGGTGLIITGLSRVSPREVPLNPTLGIYDDSFIPGLAALVRAIRDNGSRAGIQLANFVSHARSPMRCVSLKGVQYDTWYPMIHPAARTQKGYPHEEYTVEEIRDLITAYGDAALRAKMAGFDMIEVHGAHSHGLSLFLSPRANQRADAYGGSPENRRRILLEVIETVRGKVGREYPLGVRINGADSSSGETIEETVETVKALERLGIDLIHVSGEGAASPMTMPAGQNIWAAEAVKKAVTIPVVASGGITTPELAEAALAAGKADFISLARPLFADPAWPLKAREGRPEDIRPCIRCNDGCALRTGRGPIMCTVNPVLGKEKLLPLEVAEVPKRVAVIGGGPAGMEAAGVAARRGHEVTLFEKRQLGGVLAEASAPEFKADIRRLISYYVTQMEKLGIEVVNEEATAAAVKQGGYQAVIVAVGAAPMKLDIPGADSPIVVDALEVLNGSGATGRRVHVVGGGVIGAEVALFLAEQGKEVVLTSRQAEIIPNVSPYDRSLFIGKLAGHKVEILTRRQLEAVTDKGTVVVDADGSRREIAADSVVLASGYLPRTDLRDELEKEPGLDVYAAGDCLGARMILDAVHEGHLAARKI
jgi:2,4-dienoyl-CoA reductase-like NADH-dependent reductase (Old Yellow Enzyme family)/thioredoxin reductase